MLWHTAFVVICAMSAMAAGEPVSGKVFVFGRVSKLSQPINITDVHAEALDEEYRAVGVAPNAMALISVGSTDDGTIWRLDDPGKYGGLNSEVPNMKQWCHVCKGVMHTVAIQCDGEAFMWGPLSHLPANDPDGAVAPGINPTSIWSKSRVIQASCGHNHTILLTEDRDVVVLGETSYDRLGIDGISEDDTPAIYSPVLLPSLSLGHLIGDDTVCFVNAGAKSSFAVTERGDMYVWGANEFGQLGTGSVSRSVSIPQLVDMPEFRVCEIAAADEYTIAYDHNGDFWSWGNGNPVPTKHGGNPVTQSWFQSLTSRPIQLAASQFHSAMLLANGSVFTMGYNRFGQLGVTLPDQSVPPSLIDGIEPESSIWTLIPKQVAYLDNENIGSIFANGNYTVAHANMKTPMNCGCAIGRSPTTFGIPGSVPYMVSAQPPPRPKAPKLKMDNVFAPVAPNKMKPRLPTRSPIAGEVELVPPVTLETLPDIFVDNTIANNANKRPELAATVATFYVYPKNSEEAKIFGVGKSRDERRLFGRLFEADGYLYGDDGDSATVPIPKTNQGPSLMPDYTGNDRPKSRYAQPVDSSVFSLSLQDVKKYLGKEAALMQARKTTANDLKDKFDPVDFKIMAENFGNIDLEEPSEAEPNSGV